MSTSLSLLFLGATTTISLVAAIGAQGTFVLRQGILGRHITPIIIFCVLSDALMIGLGIVGLGALLDAAPWLAGPPSTTAHPRYPPQRQPHAG